VIPRSIRSLSTFAAAPVNPPAWALAWFVTTFVITKNVKEHFAIVGASGAIVFALATWLV
jgi:hypothetical protein